MNIIEELFEEYNTYNPFVLAQRMNVKVRYMPLPERIKGKYQPCIKNEYILLNESLANTQEEYFVCAHEVYHAIEHQGAEAYYSASYKANSKLEYEADEFAIQLMIKDNEGIYDSESIYRYMDRLGIPSEYEYVVKKYI